jgi:peptidoglycan hydrolase-like protein with peptidoglycan-binding domain
MLSIKDRQIYLKALGFYPGQIDGIEGPMTKLAYRSLQNKYFTRSCDKDGVYGKNTDILLQNAYNFKDSQYFKLEELKCQCGGKYCTGYPTIIDKQLIKNLNEIRKIYGPIKITSGLRCTKHNANVGGVSGSKHVLGKAVDTYQSNMCSTYSKRKIYIQKWLDFHNSQMGYCNGYMKYQNCNPTSYSSKTMGNVVHLQVK